MNLATESHSAEHLQQAQQGPKYAFVSEDDWFCGDSGLGVEVPDVVINSGAAYNVMGQQTWQMLKVNGIKCESRKSARELFAYGGTEPLLTLGSFTAKTLMILAERNNHICRTNFVVVKGNG